MSEYVKFDVRFKWSASSDYSDELANVSTLLTSYNLTPDEVIIRQIDPGVNPAAAVTIDTSNLTADSSAQLLVKNLGTASGEHLQVTWTDSDANANTTRRARSNSH